jgi:broad specificity phosphatase PhoE
VRLLLIRHAMPELDPAVPPHRWRLGERGHIAARALRLPPGASLVASDEIKAIETVRAASGGADVRPDAGFAEVRRPAAWRPDHKILARAYVDGAHHDGWEPRAEVVARFDAAITRHAVPGPAVLVVGTHGMALTCWLAAHGRITGTPGAFWAALAFPDVVEVHLPAAGKE